MFLFVRLSRGVFQFKLIRRTKQDAFSLWLTAPGPVRARGAWHPHHHPLRETASVLSQITIILKWNLAVTELCQGTWQKLKMRSCFGFWFCHPLTRVRTNTRLQIDFVTIAKKPAQAGPHRHHRFPDDDEMAPHLHHHHPPTPPRTCCSTRIILRGRADQSSTDPYPNPSIVVLQRWRRLPQNIVQPPLSDCSDCCAAAAALAC